MQIKRAWYTPTNDITSPDTIQQILVFGSLKEIQLLKKIVGEKTLREIFLQYPKKIYTPQTLNFIKNYILHITVSIDEQNYLKSTPRNIK